MLSGAGCTKLSTSLSLNIIAMLKWKLLLESVEKVVSKSECRKLFQPGLNYHIVGTLLIFSLCRVKDFPVFSFYTVTCMSIAKGFESKIA